MTVFGRSFDLSARNPASPQASATFEKSGLDSSVPKFTKPSAFISTSTKLYEELLNTTTLTGRSCSTSVSSSPISIDSPPSPASAITCRPGEAAWAPIACDSALAMDPWVNDPTIRRRPFIVR